MSSQIVSVWSGDCYSNTAMSNDVLKIRSERKYYPVCIAALDYASKHKDTHFRVGIYMNNKLRYIGFAWKGYGQSDEKLALIRESLKEDALDDFVAQYDLISSVVIKE